MARLRTHGARILSLPVLAALAALPAPASAQNVKTTGLALQNNAVRITTTFEGLPNPVPGFGVILREAGDTLYVVTARHVVVSEYGAARRSIAVAFADRDREVEATFLREDELWDLALLAVPKPSGYRWIFRRAIGIDSVGSRVGIIGRDGEWRPTGATVTGEVTAIREGEIIADFTGARIGVSGGPLVTDGGIIGLVYEDAGSVVYAYRIASVRRIVLGDWLGIEELDPPDFPFAALAITPGWALVTGDMTPRAADFPPLGVGVSVEVAFSPLIGVALEAERAATQSAIYLNPLDDRTYEFENRFTGAGVHLAFHSRGLRDSGEYLAVGVSRLWLDPRLRIDDAPFLPIDDLPGAAPVPSRRAWAYSVTAGLDGLLPAEFFWGVDLRLAYTTTPYMNITILDPFAEQTGNDWFAVLRLRVGYMLRPDQSRLRILRY